MSSEDDDTLQKAFELIKCQGEVLDEDRIIPMIPPPEPIMQYFKGNQTQEEFLNKMAMTTEMLSSLNLVSIDEYKKELMQLFNLTLKDTLSDDEKWRNIACILGWRIRTRDGIIFTHSTSSQYGNRHYFSRLGIGYFDIEVETEEEASSLFFGMGDVEWMKPKINKLSNGKWLYTYDITFPCNTPVNEGLYVKCTLPFNIRYKCIVVPNNIWRQFAFRMAHVQKLHDNVYVASHLDCQTFFDLDKFLVTQDVMMQEWQSLQEQLWLHEKVNRKNALHLQEGPCFIDSIKVNNTIQGEMKWYLYTRKIESSDIESPYIVCCGDLIQRDKQDVSYFKFNERCPNYTIGYGCILGGSWSTGIIHENEDTDAIEIPLEYPLKVLKCQWINEDKWGGGYKITLMNLDVITFEKEEHSYYIKYNGKSIFSREQLSDFEAFEKEFGEVYKTFCVCCPEENDYKAPSSSLFLNEEGRCYVYTNGMMYLTLPPFIHYVVPEKYIDRFKEVIHTNQYSINECK